MTLLQSAWLRKRINSTDVQKPTKTVFSVFIVGIRYFGIWFRFFKSRISALSVRVPGCQKLQMTA